MLERLRLKFIMVRAGRMKRAASRKTRRTAEKPAEVPRVPDGPDSYLVFKKVCPGTGLFIFSPIGFITIPCALAVLFFVKPHYPLVALAAIAALTAAQLVMNRVRHAFFRGWTGRLPYRLEGWDDLVRSKHMYADLCWTDIGIAVNFSHEDARCREVVGAALLLFCRRAKRAFYQKKMGEPDRRTEWCMSGESSAAGSANPDVMRYMKKLFEKDVAAAARRFGCIEAVAILIRSKEYEVPIEISSSEGTAS